MFQMQVSPFVCVRAHVGTLQVRYNLGGLKELFTIDVDQRNLANGQPHTINMSRINRTITIQVCTHTHTPSLRRPSIVYDDFRHVHF